MKKIILISALVVALLIGVLIKTARHTSESASPTEVQGAIEAKASREATPQLTASSLVISPLARPTVTLAPGTVAVRQAVLDTTSPQISAAIRQRAVRSLPDDLSSDDRNLLTAYLREWHEEDETQIGQVLKNDVMDALLRQQSPAFALGTLFIEIYHDSGQNAVVRDYAVQHLSMASERLTEPSGWGPDEIQIQRRAINEALWEAATGSAKSTRGTALLGLARLAEANLGIDRQKVIEAGLVMAADSTADEAARISAIQACSRLQGTTALPLITQVAGQAETIPLRISAIGALGTLGGNNELPLLGRIANESDRLKPVAETAIQRIKQRNSGPL